MLKKNSGLPYLLMAPALTLLVLLTLYPIASNIFNSLLNYNLMDPFNRGFAGFGNYLKALLDISFWHSLSLSVYFTFTAVVLELILGFILALLLAEEFRGRKFFRTMIMMPLILTPVAFSFGWRMMYHPSIGVINFFLNKLGIPSVNWLADPHLAMLSLIIIDVWQCTPFMMLIILAGITSLPTEPFEAARVDGATGIQMFWRVTIPLLKPVFIIAVLFRTLDAFKTFDIFMTMTGGGPGAATEVLNLYTYLNSFRFLNIGYASALAVLMLLISFILGVILIRIGEYK